MKLIEPRCPWRSPQSPGYLMKSHERRYHELLDEPFFDDRRAARVELGRDPLSITRRMSAARFQLRWRGGRSTPMMNSSALLRL